MGKPTICKGENKGADQLRSNCEADQRLCFRNTDSTVPLLLKVSVCVRPVQKPHCWFFHEVAQMYNVERTMNNLHHQLPISDRLVTKDMDVGLSRGRFPVLNKDNRRYMSHQQSRRCVGNMYPVKIISANITSLRLFHFTCSL